MIILNSFVTPLSVRRETLQKKFPFFLAILHVLRCVHIFFKLLLCFMCFVLYCCVTRCYLCCVLYCCVTHCYLCFVRYCCVTRCYLCCVLYCCVTRCYLCCVLYCCVTHCYLCSSSCLPGTLELFGGICWREPVCKQWNITIFWKFIFFLTQWNIEAILQYCWEYFFFTSTTGLWETSRNHRAPLAAVSPHCQSDQAGKSYFQSTSKNKKS